MSRSDHRELLNRREKVRVGRWKTEIYLNYSFTLSISVRGFSENIKYLVFPRLQHWLILQFSNWGNSPAAWLGCCEKLIVPSTSSINFLLSVVRKCPVDREIIMIKYNILNLNILRDAITNMRKKQTHAQCPSGSCFYIFVFVYQLNEDMVTNIVSWILSRNFPIYIINIYIIEKVFLSIFIKLT